HAQGVNLGLQEPQEIAPYFSRSHPPITSIVLPPTQRPRAHAEALRTRLLWVGPVQIVRPKWVDRRWLLPGAAAAALVSFLGTKAYCDLVRARSTEFGVGLPQTAFR